MRLPLGIEMNGFSFRDSHVFAVAVAIAAPRRKDPDEESEQNSALASFVTVSYRPDFLRHCRNKAES
jgi:hypothetical protein